MEAATQESPAASTVAAGVVPADIFVTVPEVTLPSGRVVPSFKVGAYLTGKQDDRAVVTREAAPWVEINFADSKAAALAAGFALITETQYLAIAHDIARQDINWSGGKVGDGHIFMGIHKGNVYEAQPGTFETIDGDERRWHQLSNGSVVWDFAGNAYSWVFDDVQGDGDGLILKPFEASSDSIDVPHPSMNKGVGWYPTPGSDWSGDALFRGGCWCSGSTAGVFSLGSVWPDDGSGGVGFRCTKPIGL